LRGIKLQGSVIIIIFLWVGLFPAGLIAQKEEPPPAQDKRPQASYFDFGDILVPSELSLDKKNSFIYGNSRFKVGILVFEGRVEPSSLASFFQNNMQRDGWILLSSFKYREYLLSFLKEDRACVITVTEKPFTTTLEIRVGPIEQARFPFKGTPSR